MVRETSFDVITTRRVDFKLVPILLNQLAGENWEEIRTHASRNFWISLLSLFGCQVLKKLWYMLLLSFLQHMSHLFMYSLLEGEGRNTTPSLRSPLSANWLSGSFAPNNANQHCCSTEGNYILVMMSISSSQESFSFLIL